MAASRNRAEQPVAQPLSEQAPESALLSEEALAQDWTRPEEDDAWAHLQQVR